jgi:zinc protease
VMIQTTSEQLVPTLKLVNEILRTPTFPDAELEKMRDEELAGIEQQRSEPQSIASVMYDRKVKPYPASDFRYSMNFDEQAQAVKAVKTEDLKKFYSGFYNSSNATVAIVGDFDEAPVLQELSAMLGSWSSPVTYTRAVSKNFDIPATSEKINTPDKANAMMMAGMILPLRDDDADFAALTMGNYMLGGGFLNSRLATRIRQKDGLSYGVGSFLQADAIDKSGAFGSFAIYNPDNSAKLVAAYKEEIERMLKEGFTDQELKDAVSGYLQGRNVSRSQDRELTGRLSNYLYLNRTILWEGDLEKKIAALTVAQVNEAMRKWINPGKITFVEAGDFERKKE